MSSTWTETFYLTELLPPRIYFYQLNLSLSILWKKKESKWEMRHMIQFGSDLKENKNLGHTHTPGGYPAIIQPYSERPIEEEVSFRRKNLWLNPSARCIYHQLSIPIWQKPKKPGRAGRSLLCRVETNGPTRIFQLCICSDSSFVFFFLFFLFPSVQCFRCETINLLVLFFFFFPSITLEKKCRTVW